MKVCCLLIAAMLPVCAFACSCGRIERACEAYRIAPIIFIGTVAELGSRDVGSDGVSYSQQVRFAVDESFKGTDGKAVTVNRIHFRSSCPVTTPEFDLGKKFLVWASDDGDGNALVTDCSPTQRLEDATQFTSELRGLQSGTGETYIFGDVYRSRDLPDGFRLEEMAKYSDVPLSGTWVSVRSANLSYRVLTDEKGHFVLPLQRSGEYHVAADLPSYVEQGSVDIQLEYHDCANVSLWTRYSFPFVGRVVDEHRLPLARVYVKLLRAGTLDSSQAESGFTDENGEYKLVASEAGDYLIAVNWDDVPPEAPYRTAFYPGAQDLESAQIVHTEAAGAVALTDFVLPHPIECTVHIEVKDGKNGHPANAIILTKNSPSQFWRKAADVNPDGKASFTIVGPGRTYLVASQALSADEELRSEAWSTDSCPDTPLHLKLTIPFRLTDN